LFIFRFFLLYSFPLLLLFFCNHNNFCFTFKTNKTKIVDVLGPFGVNERELPLALDLIGRATIEDPKRMALDILPLHAVEKMVAKSL
jgi:hypothetical protein